MLTPTAERLEQYMTLLSTRQRLTSSNIANADTPGYKTKDIDFQTELRNAMNGNVTPAIVDVPGLAVKNDGNNVSLDREARLVAENAIRFNLAARLLHGQIQSVRAAMQEGRG
jgi:flagellar basal-body rod protein FlgB